MWTVVCYHEKTITSYRNDLILGTVVALNTALKCIDFGFKRSRSGHRVNVFKFCTSCLQGPGSHASWKVMESFEM